MVARSPGKPAISACAQPPRDLKAFFVKVCRFSDRRCLAVTCIALLCAVGCGDGRPSLVPVEGTITVDGVAVEGVQIVFKVVDVAGDYKRPSSAVTDSQGKFRVGTYGKDDGMPVGKYAVGIIKKEVVGQLPDDYNSEDPSLSSKPIKYRWVTPEDKADPDTSGLTAEVTSEGLNPSTFALEGGGAEEVVGGGRRRGDP